MIKNPTKHKFKNKNFDMRFEHGQTEKLTQGRPLIAN